MAITLKINQILNGSWRGKTKDQQVWIIVLNPTELIGNTIHMIQPGFKDIRPHYSSAWTTNELVPVILDIIISANYFQDIPVTLKIRVNLALTPIQLTWNTIHWWINKNMFFFFLIDKFTHAFTTVPPKVSLPFLGWGRPNTTMYGMCPFEIVCSNMTNIFISLTFSN